MILVKPSFAIQHITPNPLQSIEWAARTCYKSESRITDETAPKFVKMLIDRGHEAMLEHAMMTVRFVVDRGVSHEIVRHRLCSFAQESTRYCNYKGGVMFVIPPWVDLLPGVYDSHTLDGAPMKNGDREWVQMMLNIEASYACLVENGWPPQQARSVLPNSLKTEIIVTANFREWRHIFKLRTARAAHPQMREVMIPLLNQAKTEIPVIFDDITQ